MGVLIFVATGAARAIYAVFKGVFPARHKVVFLSRQSETPSRDFEAIAQALRDADPTLEIVVRCRMVGHTWASRAGAAVSTIGQMYHLATARACVVDGYVIPVSVLDHRRGLFVMQIWHALGAIKKFGYQTIGAPGGHSAKIASAMRMHHNYDVVVCGGPAAVPAFAEAFGTDASRVEPLGLPRMDALRSACAAGPAAPGTAALLDRFPRLREPGHRVVLYAPTLRTGGANRYSDVAASFADDRYTLVIKPHPLESVSIAGGNIVNAQGAAVEEILPLCSDLITDYSAIAFEAAAIGVPTYFYVYDIDDYRRDTGLNLDPLIDMPDVSSRDIGTLSGILSAGVEHRAVTDMLRDGYASAPYGCAARIAHRIIDAVKADTTA